jgi:HAD superfamily hydrolase (TIGR01549 family)
MTADRGRVDTAVFDVDGTLVDTNYQHALAWYRAFRSFDIVLPVWRLHRAIGMGGDNLVAHVADEEVESRLGSELRSAWEKEFNLMVPEVSAFEGAHELLAEVKERGLRVVLASSGKSEHTRHFLDLLGGTEIADAWTTSDDVQSSKPAPDLVSVAMEKVGGRRGVMIGDSVWDAIAAREVGVPTIAVRTGGFSTDELRDAGAGWVFDSLDELRDDIHATPLGQRSGGSDTTSRES